MVCLCYTLLKLCFGLCPVASSQCGDKTEISELSGSFGVINNVVPPAVYHFMLYTLLISVV